MTERERNTESEWVDPDDAPEWPDEAWDRAQFSIGGKVVRAASGTLTKRGRPPMGAESKRQVTIRLAPAVIEHFKAGGAGWQTRIGEVLERHVADRIGIRERTSRVAEKKSGYAATVTRKDKRSKRP